MLPVCYISFHPSRDEDPEDVLLLASEWVISVSKKGWSPSIPVGAWCDLVPKIPQQVRSTLVQCSLTQLSRSEALLLVPDWEKNERCRLERHFAELNELVIYDRLRSPIDVASELPLGEDFQEKYISLEIVRSFGHAIA